MTVSMPQQMMGQEPTPDVGVLSPNVIEQLKKSEDAKKLVSWVRTQYEKMKSDRMPYERQWRLNYAFYKGRQNLSYGVLGNLSNSVGGAKLTTPAAPPWRVRSVRNRIKPIIRTEMSKLTSNKPNASVVPASSEDEDLFAAQAAEQVWESLFANKKLHKVFTRSMFWLTITGTSFIKDWWDPSCMDSSGEYQGDLKFAPVSPFYLFVPDMLEEELEDQPYIMNVYTKSVDWVKMCYGVDLKPTVVSATELIGDSLFRTSGNDAKPDACLVIEVWIKPYGHPLFPQGGMVTVVDTTIVGMYSEGMMYNHNEYPFTKFSHIPTGEFYADSVINDLISPQREYNRTSSQIIESKNRMARPQLMAPMGSIDPGKITTEPGQVILYRPGLAPPSPLPMQPLPSYVLQEMDRSIMDMEDISSQHAVSRGDTPAGVTAATAISFLQERDDSPMSTTYQSVEFGYEKIAKHAIANVVQFWETPRVVSTTGVEGYFDAITLKGSDIASGTDIRMEAGSALPVSKAARQAFLLDMMTRGFIPPDKGLSMMDMGGINKLYAELQVDQRAAQRENLRMRRLDIEEIMSHMKQVEQSNYVAEQAQQQAAMQQAPQMGQQIQQQMPGLPQDVTDPNNAMAAVQGLEAMSPSQPPQPQVDAGFGQDTQTQAPLTVSPALIPVNTWDNHQVHIDEHNRFRKSQAFDLLPEEVKQQFEAHVQMHAMALNQASQNAMAQMPGGAGPSNPLGGADNGSGTPVGSNQFGPPGTTDGGGTPPPPGM